VIADPLASGTAASKALETQMNTDEHRSGPSAGISAPAATFLLSYLCSSVFICVSNVLTPIVS
jgi:hypothetical protein